MFLVPALALFPFKFLISAYFLAIKLDRKNLLADRPQLTASKGGKLSTDL